MSPPFFWGPWMCSAIFIVLLPLQWETQYLLAKDTTLRSFRGKLEEQNSERFIPWEPWMWLSRFHGVIWKRLAALDNGPGWWKTKGCVIWGPAISTVNVIVRPIVEDVSDQLIKPIRTTSGSNPASLKHTSAKHRVLSLQSVKHQFPLGTSTWWQLWLSRTFGGIHLHSLPDFHT